MVRTVCRSVVSQPDTRQTSAQAPRAGVPVLMTETPRVEPQEADYAFRTQGCKAGQVLPGLASTYLRSTTAFLKGGRGRVEAHDWSRIAQFTASVPAIGLTDVALGLMTEDEGGDVEGFLRRGAITLLLRASCSDRPPTPQW